MKITESYQKFHLELLAEIDTLCEMYVAKVRDMTSKDRKEHFEKIEELFAKSREYGDDKVQLAVQTYEMVSFL